MDLTTQLLEIVLVPILTVITGFIVTFLKAKSQEVMASIKNDKLRKYISMLEDIVCNAVTATNQTYVEALKKEGRFDAEAQQIAFDTTKKAVLLMLTEEAKTVLQEAYTDLSDYINTLIEAQVNVQHG